jgi:hypothetical protein
MPAAAAPPSHLVQQEIAMKAQVGDQLIVEGNHVGVPRRVGVIVEVRHADGTPPYVVRWAEDGHEGLVFPGPECRVEPSAG